MLGVFVCDEHADIPDPTNDQHAIQHVSTGQSSVDRGAYVRTAATDRRPLDERKLRSRARCSAAGAGTDRWVTSARFRRGERSMEGCQTPVTAWLNAEKVAHASPCVTADASTSALSAAEADVLIRARDSRRGGKILPDTAAPMRSMVGWSVLPRAAVQRLRPQRHLLREEGM